MALRGSVAASPSEAKRDKAKSITRHPSDDLADSATSEVALATIGGLSGDAPMLHANAVSLEDGGGRCLRAVRTDGSVVTLTADPTRTGTWPMPGSSCDGARVAGRRRDGMPGLAPATRS
jgi:hypothetical protein